MPYDAVGFQPETTPAFDLTTPRGRLLYLRDHVIPRIPLGQIDMDMVDCGTHACLCGWARRDVNLIRAGIRLYEYMQIAEHGAFFGLSLNQGLHLFMSSRYGATRPTHAQLQAHVDDVLSGRVK